MRGGEWEFLEGRELRGATMGIVGLGGVGGELAAIGNALGMEVICWTRRPSAERAKRHRVRFVELDELLSSADFVQLNLALNEGTRGLIGRRELGLMRADAYLVNTARSGIVDEPALIEALDEGRIAGYATDVFETEPTYDEPLARCTNTILTPHVAFNTPDAKRRMIEIGIDNVVAYLEGEPQNLVSA